MVPSWRLSAGGEEDASYMHKLGLSGHIVENSTNKAVNGFMYCWILFELTIHKTIQVDFLELEESNCTQQRTAMMKICT